MALISPILDDRTLRRSCATSWSAGSRSTRRSGPTTTRATPGIALLELFAYLGESLLFRFNQIPDTTKIEFLRLLGVQPRPAQPAHGAARRARTELPDGVQVLEGTEAQAGSVPFETDDEVYVWPLDVRRRSARRPPTADRRPRPGRGAGSRRAGARRTSTAGDRAVLRRRPSCRPTRWRPDAVPLDVSAHGRPRAVDRAAAQADDRRSRQLAGRIVFVGVAFDESVDRRSCWSTLDAAGADGFRLDGLDRRPAADAVAALERRRRDEAVRRRCDGRRRHHPRPDHDRRRRGRAAGARCRAPGRRRRRGGAGQPAAADRRAAGAARSSPGSR